MKNEVSDSKYDKNLACQVIFRYLKKLELQILKCFFKLSGMIKLVLDSQNLEALPDSVLKEKLEYLINQRTIPGEFTRKFLFSESLLVVARKNCAYLKEQNPGVWDDEIQRAVQIFHVEADKLKDVLYQWKYDHLEGEDDDDGGEDEGDE